MSVDLFSEYRAYARACGLAEKTTVADRLAVVRSCLRAVGDPKTVDRAALTAWLAEPGWSAWTRITYLMHLKAFFRWLCEFGHRDDDPAAGLKRPRVPRGLPRPVTDVELAHALAHSPQWFARALVLCAFAGLRISEAAALKREDVTEVQITVRDGKGGTTAALPCHPEIWSQFSTWVRDRFNRVAPSRVYQLLDGWKIRSEFLPHVEITPSQEAQLRPLKSLLSVANGRGARIPEVTCHRFRHWFGTNVQRAQGDIRVTQELMRHASIASTAGYTQVSTAAKVAAVAGLAVCGVDIDARSFLRLPRQRSARLPTSSVRVR